MKTWMYNLCMHRLSWSCKSGELFFFLIILELTDIYFDDYLWFTALFESVWLVLYLPDFVFDDIYDCHTLCGNW